MCISKFKEATKKVARYLRDNTQIDYFVALNCINWVFKLLPNLDATEQISVLQLIDSKLSRMEISRGVRRSNPTTSTRSLGGRHG